MQEHHNNLCECGCGQLAPIAQYTNAAKGYFRGQQVRFVRGHHRGSGFQPVAAGARFGRLVVLEERTDSFLLVQCECGETAISRRAVDVISGKIQSCGCLKREHIAALGRAKRFDPTTPPTHRVCTCCGVGKSLSEFTQSKRSGYGRSHECKMCATKRSREWAQENPERADELRRRATLRRIGATPEQYADRVDSQGHVCAICGEPESRQHQEGKVCRLALDHNHATGQIRGALCSSCNLALGKLNDDPVRLRAAADYLDHWRSRAAMPTEG
jgi:hypothetical protein